MFPEAFLQEYCPKAWILQNCSTKELPKAIMEKILSVNKAPELQINAPKSPKAVARLENRIWGGLVQSSCSMQPLPAKLAKLCQMLLSVAVAAKMRFCNPCRKVFPKPFSTAAPKKRPKAAQPAPENYF
jgi:hypothetical protein